MPDFIILPDGNSGLDGAQRITSAAAPHVLAAAISPPGTTALAW